MSRSRLFIPSCILWLGLLSCLPAASGQAPADALSSTTDPITLDGQLACLPERVSIGPDGVGLTTDMCAIGLRGQDELYYGLMDLPPEAREALGVGKLSSGQAVRVVGTLIPATTDRYHITGTIRVQAISLQEPPPIDPPDLGRDLP